MNHEDARKVIEFFSNYAKRSKASGNWSNVPPEKAGAIATIATELLDEVEGLKYRKCKMDVAFENAMTACARRRKRYIKAESQLAAKDEEIERLKRLNPNSPQRRR